MLFQFSFWCFIWAMHVIVGPIRCLYEFGRYQRDADAHCDAWPLPAYYAVTRSESPDSIPTDPPDPVWLAFIFMHARTPLSATPALITIDPHFVLSFLGIIQFLVSEVHLSNFLDVTLRSLLVREVHHGFSTMWTLGISTRTINLKSRDVIDLTDVRQLWRHTIDAVCFLFFLFCFVRFRRIYTSVLVCVELCLPLLLSLFWFACFK